MATITLKIPDELNAALGAVSTRRRVSVLLDVAFQRPGEPASSCGCPSLRRPLNYHPE